MSKKESKKESGVKATALQKTAVLLIAHGSRRADANADLIHLADLLRAEGQYPIVKGAFLELAEPSIEDAGAQCVREGATRVLMLPYFLSAGVHVQRDLSELRQQLAERFADVDFRLGEPLGRHPLLVRIVAERAGELDDSF